MLSPGAAAGDARGMTYECNKSIGDYGERVAADHLRSLGMVILATQWTCKFGEIDIVARDGSTLVICEVKTRTSHRYGGPFEAVTGQKAARLRRLATHWLEVNDVDPPSVRIDVVSVLLPPAGAPVVDRIAGVA